MKPHIDGYVPLEAYNKLLEGNDRRHCHAVLNAQASQRGIKRLRRKVDYWRSRADELGHRSAEYWQQRCRAAEQSFAMAESEIIALDAQLDELKNELDFAHTPELSR